MERKALMKMHQLSDILDRKRKNTEDELRRESYRLQQQQLLYENRLRTIKDEHAEDLLRDATKIRIETRAQTFLEIIDDVQSLVPHPNRRNQSDETNEVEECLEILKNKIYRKLDKVSKIDDEDDDDVDPDV